MVANNSPTLTGWSLTAVPSLSVAPITWPPLTAPPPTTTDQQRAQWSRPAFWLIRGVRPNSPIQTTTVSCHIPLCTRSSTSAATALSSTGSLVLSVGKMFWWLSQPPKSTSTQTAPASTRFRANRQPLPKPLLPYFSTATLFLASPRSNSFERSPPPLPVDATFMSGMTSLNALS